MTILGRPIIVLPADRPGCMERVTKFLTIWGIRLLFALGFFLMGYGCAVMRN